MSRYLMLALATLSLSLAACGKDSDKNKGQPSGGRNLNNGAYPNIAQTVFGQWQAQDELDNGIFVSPKLYVNQNSVGLEMTCRKGRDTGTLAFAVNARVGEDTIDILESAERSAQVGNGSCTGKLGAGRFAYSVNGNQLTLELDEKSVIQLNRIL